VSVFLIGILGKIFAQFFGAANWWCVSVYSVFSFFPSVLSLWLLLCLYYNCDSDYYNWIVDLWSLLSAGGQLGKILRKLETCLVYLKIVCVYDWLSPICRWYLYTGIKKTAAYTTTTFIIFIIIIIIIIAICVFRLWYSGLWHCILVCHCQHFGVTYSSIFKMEVSQSGSE
jgi:hypothetical protein